MQYVPGSGEEVIRVLVADDTRIHTQLLADALRRDPLLEVISSPSHSRDLVEAARAQKVDVVIISASLDEDPQRGFEVLRELRASDPQIHAIMLLDSSKRESILQAFRVGARGIFSRHESVESLSKCVRSVHHGQIWANSQQMSFAVEALASSPVIRAVDARGLSLLSKRELEVVRSLAEGLSNREIAEHLGLSQHTIKNYLFRVFDKLGVSSRLELLFMTLSHTAYFAAGTVEKSNGSGSRSRAKGSSVKPANGDSSGPHIQKEPAMDHVARLHVVPAAAPEQRRSPEKVSGNQPHQNIASAGGAEL